jgi:hypothetical protein
VSAAGSQQREGIGAALQSRRMQLALAAVAAAVVAAVVVVVVASGSSTEPPATGAATVVPGDALAYVHFSTDRSRPAVRDALRLAGRMPTFSVLSGVVTSRLAAIAGGRASGASSSLNYQDDIRPWLGKEAAIAFVDTATSTAGSEIVLDVKSLRKARAFVARSGASSAGSLHGVNRYRLRTGTELAFIRHYLVLGQPATVDSAIDAGRNRRSSLAGSSAYQRAAAGEPAGRVVDMYFSTAGITRLLAPQGGVFGALGALLFEPSELGSTISVSAAGVGARLYVHTALAQGPGAHRGRAFTPTLTSELPSGTLFALDVTELDRVAPRVLGAGADAGIAGKLGPLLGHLGDALSSEGVNVRSIEALFGGETAIAIVPVSKGTPALVVIARTANERKVREQLANLEVPLSQLFPAPAQGSGQVPQFNTRQVDGVAAHQITLTAGLALDYAVFRGLVVVSTSLQGIAAVARHSGSLQGEPAYSQALPGQPRPVTSVVFAAFSQLLRLAERTGLVRGVTYQALRPDLNRIRAVGVQTTRGQASSTAQIALDIP